MTKPFLLLTGRAITFAAGQYPMQESITNDISNFFIAGINYKKTDADIRGQYAINADQYAEALRDAHSHGISELFILSTCNRTEIYGFADSPSQLINLLCAHTSGNSETFRKLCYTRKGIHAIEHLFKVGAGLDSQILGDYEIVGQIRQAVKFAKENNFIGACIDRLVNAVLQSSKAIKNQTALSGGTVSVSFAAVQYIRKTMPDLTGKKILLLGVGKIGRNTCKNLVDYLNTTNITLINRTAEKAESLATELGLQHASPEDLALHIKDSDIIIVATNATSPTLLYSHLEGKGEKLIIDLSIPYNVETAAQSLANVTLVNVDELSKMKDETVKKRQAEVPKAKAIINAYVTEFLEWHEMRKHVPTLKAVKNKLHEMNAANIYFQPSAIPVLTTADNHHEKIQKIINVMAIKMRQQNRRGCHYIEAINDFMGVN